MKDLCVDVETTTYNSGNPFDRRNQLVCVAFCEAGGSPTVVRADPAGLVVVQSAIDRAERLVGFNLKFDLHWLRKSGIDFGHCRAYDVQAAEFVLSGQTHKFPSLDEVSLKYLNETKIDEVRGYWERGVQTNDIPWETLSAYAAKDVDLTLQAATKQILQTPEPLKKLISLVNHDLLVLEEMEWNGLRFDRERALAKAEEVEKRIRELQAKHGIEQQIPNFNWGSGDHLSALLYGGTIKEIIKVPVGHFKTGTKVGQERFKNEVREHILPRKYEPPKGSKGKKEGVFSTDEATLLAIKGGKRGLLNDLLEIRQLQKEISTYLRGFPEKQDEGCYDKDFIYGQFNQCVASTGRLSSSKPNLQNLSEEIGRCLKSRY
jgi:DNA polymerase-1